MANSEQTKRALAEGLKTALRSQEFDQITVADITECSEVRDVYKRQYWESGATGF